MLSDPTAHFPVMGCPGHPPEHSHSLDPLSSPLPWRGLCPSLMSL